jgi:cell division septation protein DedD
MRLSTAIIVTALIALTGCRDDPQPEPPPQDADRPVVDPAADTVAPDDDVPLVPGPARPGQPDPDQVTPDDAAAAGGARYTVQVAAFTNLESAELWTDRLSRQGLPVWSSVSELGGRTFYRVRVGAVPDFAEARQLGDMLSERYEWPVWVAPLSAADRVPAGAVANTRRVIGAG